MNEISEATAEALSGAVLDVLRRAAHEVEDRALVVCRVLPSTRYRDGYHVQLGHRNSYRKTFDFRSGAEAAAFLQGLGEAWELTGRWQPDGKAKR